MINCAAGHECIGPTGSAGVGNPTKASPFTHYVGRNWHPGHGRVRGLTSRDVDAVSEALAGRRGSISVTPRLVLFYFRDDDLAVSVRLNPKQ